MFIQLRWYSTEHISGKIKPQSATSEASFSTTETLCSTLYKEPSFNVLQLLKQVSEIKAKCKPTIVRFLYALLETLKYYCKISRNYMLKDKSPNEVMVEYCKRVRVRLT